jgi:hypothetical protein
MDPSPHGISLDVMAAITAEIAEGDRPASRVLEARGLSRTQWDEASLFWHRQLATEAFAGGETPLAEAYSEAFTRAQDGLAPIPELTPEDWAALTVEMARGDAARALASRGLSSSDHLRLSRRWATLLSRDRALGERYQQAFYALQEEGGPEPR